MRQQHMAKQRGFTLVEVMIVAAIIAILAMIAVPTYRESVVRSTRADAQATLIAFSQAMERHYSNTYSYLAAAASGNTGAPDPSVFASTAPLEGQAYYNLSITAATAEAYTLRATPIAGSRQDGDGVIELSSLGVRGRDRNGDGDTADTGENNWDR